MANVTTELKVVVRSVGKGEIDKLSKALNDLGSKALKPVDQKLKSSVAELKQLSSQSTQTKNNIKGFSNAFKELANNLEIGSKEFKEATAEAKRLDAQLEKLEGRKPARGARLRGAAQTVGAIAAGGVFGGPEGALGAAIGGIAGGGPAGAAVGAAIGAQVGQLRQAAGATAEYAANLSKLRIAFLGVTTSQEEYQQGLVFIQQTTKDFAIPQEVVTRQFTKLQASVQGAGGNLEDTKTAFNGIVAAVRATGGSLSDVDAALTATAQVFSKGKVSAEELRQQIGERLPGAFTLFADSMGKTPQELDKALEKGEVSLQDFQKFAEAIFKRYGENAKAIASGPESAGDRLKVVLEELSENIGTLLAPIGSAFQTVFAEIAKAINIAIKALNRFLGLGEEGLEARIKRLGEQIDTALATAEYFEGAPMGAQARKEAARLFEERSDLMVQLRELQARGVEQPEAGTGLPGITDLDSGGAAGRARKDISKAEAALRKQIVEARRNENDLLAAQLGFDLARQKLSESDLKDRERSTKLLEINQNEHDAIVKILEDRAKKQTETIDGVEIEEKALFAVGKQLAENLNAQDQFAKKLSETDKLYKQVGKTIQQSVGSAIEGLIFSTQSLGESLSNFAKSLASMFLQFGIKTAFSALGEGGGFLGKLFGSANGNVFAENKIVPFAYGGIVDKPTLFPMANGMGLMGEAGPEAIMPLRRNSSGRLGVEAAGTGFGSVVVNVDATGSSVQGSQPNSAQLGKAIGAAVQAELIKQKRPGGLLSR